MIERLSLPNDLASHALPPAIDDLIQQAAQVVQTFQDRWEVPDIEQYVAADFWLVAAALQHLVRGGVIDGGRFLEWGCGIGVVTQIADHMSLDAIGIESVATLVDQAQAFKKQVNGRGEIVLGNFLPPRAETLADDPTLPSLNHPQRDPYALIESDIDDFAVIYSYPWPGEEWFHRDVFDRHAREYAIHLQFLGPNDVRAFRKLGGS